MAQGHGSPLVLLHGLGERSSSLAPLHRSLAGRWAVTAVDLPGHGGSRARRGPFRLRDHVAWLADVLDELGLDRPRLVGHSLGARVALELALHRPDRVASLGLLGPPLVVVSNRGFVPAARLVAPGAAALLPGRLMGLVPPAAGAFRTALARLELADPRTRPDGWDTDVADELRRWLADPRHRVTYVAVLRRLFLGDPSRFQARLAGLSVPALFLWGEADRVSTPGQAAVVAAAAPGATVIVLPGCGHVPHAEQPDATLAALVTHLRKGPA